MAYSHLINFLFSRLEESEDSAPKETQGLVFSNLIVSGRINHNNLATEILISRSSLLLLFYQLINCNEDYFLQIRICVNKVFQLNAAIRI